MRIEAPDYSLESKSYFWYTPFYKYIIICYENNNVGLWNETRSY